MCKVAVSAGATSEGGRGGRRPPMDRRRVLAAIFWVFDNGAKWKDLPRHCGSRSAVHACFQRWTREGVFENNMRVAGLHVEESGGYKRRWTAERTIGWFQGFRRPCVRHEKSAMRFRGLLHLGCSIILLEQVDG